MNKIIFICFILSTTYYSCDSMRERREVICNTFMMLHPGVCGTDGRDYYDLETFKCVQRTERGKRINLQLRHEGGCWIWEQHGYETYTVLSVTKTLTITQFRNKSVKLLFELSLQILLVLFSFIGVCWFLCRAKRAVKPIAIIMAA